jgi:hypothetical protein
MQKNVASQKFVVFAYNRTNNTPLTGDAANITANITLNSGTAAATNDVNPTETEDGFYEFDATQAETNANALQVFPASSTANIQVISVPGVIYTDPVAFADDIIQTGDAFARLATYRLGELMSAALASQPFTASLLGDLTQDNAGTQQFTTDALDRTWDVILTGATHNINNSSGKRLRQVAFTIFSEGTAQAGTANTLQLAAGAVTTDNQFVRAKVIITGGTGSEQEAIISDSTASTDTLTITPAWLVTPDATSTYEVMPGQTHSTTRNGGYDNGRIYVNITNGAPGTLVHVNGITTNPSDNLADARTIADGENVRIFDVKGGGLITLDQGYTDWIFDVINAALLDLNSQDISGSVFLRTGITGVGTSTSRSVFELCGLLNTTVGVCNFIQCAFLGTTTLTSEDRYTAWDCFEGDVITPIIDVAGDGITATTLQLVNYSGRIELQNMTSVDTVIVTGEAFVTLNANCTGGTLIRAGDVDLTDNSGSVTITQSDQLQITDDWTNAGRLDNILDARMAEASIDTTAGVVDRVTLTDTTTTNTDMRGTDGANTVIPDAAGVAPTAVENRQEMDSNSTELAKIETRTPTAAQLAYITSNSADGVPVTFSGGTTTTAVLVNVDGVAASSTNDVYNGRVFIFNAGTLKDQATDITDYDGATKTATITALTTAVTAAHTANLK